MTFQRGSEGVKKIDAEGARRLVLAAPIPAGELAVRIIEAYHGMVRPAGKSADECLANLDARDRAGALRAAAAAVGFFAECVHNPAGTVQ